MSHIHSNRRCSEPCAARGGSKASTLPASLSFLSSKHTQGDVAASTDSNRSSSSKFSLRSDAQYADVERVVMEVAHAVANAAREAALAQARASLLASFEASTPANKMRKAGSMPAACGEDLWSRSWTLKSKSSAQSSSVEHLVDYEENFNSSLLRNFLKEKEIKPIIHHRYIEDVKLPEDASDNSSEMAVISEQPGCLDPELVVRRVESIASGEVSQIGPTALMSSASKAEPTSGPTLLGSSPVCKHSDKSINDNFERAVQNSKGFHDIACHTCRRIEIKSRTAGLLGSFRHVFAHSQTAMNTICVANDADLSRQALESVDSNSLDTVMLEDPWQCFSWVSLWLRIWGIHPISIFGVWWNQLAGSIVVAMIAVHRLILLSFMELQVHHLCDVILTFGALGCLLAARMLHKCDLFESTELGLLKYASHCGFEGTWHSNANKYLLQAVLTWVSVVCSRIVFNLTSSVSEHLKQGSLEPLHVSTALLHCIDVVTFALPAGIFTTMTFCVLHYTNALVLAVDAFSDKLRCGADNSTLSHEWNILRALLRRASRALETGFLVLVTIAILMLILCAMDLLLPSRKAGHDTLGEILPVFVPICILAGWVSRMFFRAADVTGTCRRMPPLVNALSSAGTQGRLSSYDKHFLVEYIRNSAAGFYIREVTVTAEVALKIASIGGMAIFTVLTKAVTEN